MDLHDEDIESFGYEEAIDWLESRSVQYDHLETLDELIDLIKHQQDQLLSSDGLSRTSDEYNDQSLRMLNSQRVIKTILKRDDIIKKYLADIYADVSHFLSGDIGNDLKEVLHQMYSDIHDKLSYYASELMVDDCPIIVAGETGAGKSSLLNLLLGTEVLPLSLLSTTSTICCIHNSKTKRIVVDTVKDGKETYPISETESGERAMKEIMKTFVCSEESRCTQVCKQIDIYWPLPILPDNVTIVDTPGVGESEEMTRRLLEFLPNAVAFIYVINSSVAGGIQEDRLLRIIKEQEEWKKEGKLSAFNTSNVLFVCNKWDRVVESSEEAHVWTDTMDKLRKVLPNLNEDQVFKMSTTEAARYLKSRMGNTEKYEMFLGGLKRIVLTSLKAKVRTHYEWLRTFLLTTKRVVMSRIQHTQLNEEEKRVKYEVVRSRLQKLTTDTQKIREELLRKAKKECIKFLDELCTFVESDDFQIKILTWTEEEAPDMHSGDSDVMRYIGEKVIKAKAEKIIHDWERTYGFIEKMGRKLEAMFYEKCEMIGQDCEEIELTIDGRQQTEGLKGSFELYSRESREDVDISVPTSTKVIIGVMAPIWIPLGITAGLVALITSPVWVTIGKLADKTRLQEYNRNREKFMSDWTAKMYKSTFTRYNLERFVAATFYDRFEERIDDLCHNFIPSIIAIDQKQIDVIRQDRRTAKQILDHFTPVDDILNCIIDNIEGFEFKFLEDQMITDEDVQVITKIEDSKQSNAWRVNWICRTATTKGQVIQAALKIENNWANLAILRKLSHPNIVNVHGCLYPIPDDDEREDSLYNNISCSGMKLPFGGLLVLTDLCDGNLEDLIFNDTTKQCSKTRPDKDRKEAIKLFVETGAAICDGLSYIHSRNLMHRNLRLANVLVKNGIPKLHNMSLVVRQEMQCNELEFDELYYRSPEMLANKRYTHSTDIYSLGFLLWEMWYGHRAFSGSEYIDLSAEEIRFRVITGERPDIDQSHVFMLDGVKTIFTQCWDATQNKRYGAAELVGRELRGMLN